MYTISGKSYREVIVKTYQKLLKEGQVVSPRNKETRELENVCLVIENPRDRVPFIKHRNANIFALLAETLWTLAGRDDLKFINHYLKRLSDFSEDKIVVSGAYGPRIRQWDAGEDLFYLYDRLLPNVEVDQLKNIYNILSNDPDSRRAVICIYNPKYDYDNERMDIPCVNWMQFRVRENKLNLSVVSRSMDSVWGSAVNIFEWTILLEILSNWLNLEVGEYCHYVGSLHIYDYHYKKAERMVEHFENVALESPLEIDITQDLFDSELEILFQKEEYSRRTGQNDDSLVLKSQWLQYIDTLFLAHNNWKKYGDIGRARQILEKLEASDLLEAANDFFNRQMKAGS